MKKILAFIKKHWKTILEILGVAATAIVATDLIEGSGQKELIPNIDVKKEDAAIDLQTAQTVNNINTTAKETVQSIQNETTTEAVQSLSVEAQTQIQAVADNATNKAVDAVLNDLK